MPTRIGPAPGLPVMDIKPAHALSDLVEAWPLGQRAVLPKPGNGRVDQPIVRFGERIEVNPKPILHVGPEVLDDDIGSIGQPSKRFQALLCLEIERQASLVAVQVLKVGAGAWSAQLGAVDGRFDFDDIGTPIGKLPHAGRTGSDAGKIEDPDASQSRARQASWARLRRSFISDTAVASRHAPSCLSRGSELCCTFMTTING
jgi:hypothetical protein